MKTTEKTIKESREYKRIMKVVNSHRLVDDRVSALDKLGYCVNCLPMGTGGVGQVKVMTRLNEIRIQVGYSVGRHNYAMCVVLDIIK